MGFPWIDSSLRLNAMINTTLSMLLLVGVLLSGPTTTFGGDAPVALEPIPLNGGKLRNWNRDGGAFLGKGPWQVLPGVEANGREVIFRQPSRKDGLGKRTNEWFDAAFLRVKASKDNHYGVRQALIDVEPIVARGGDRFRIGINLRTDSPGLVGVIAELQDADGGTLVASKPMSPAVAGPEGAHRHFVDLEVPKGDAGEGPLHLAFVAKPMDDGGEGAWIELDQASIARIGSDGGEFKSMFDGKSFDGWTGLNDAYKVKDGAIITVPGISGGANIYTEEEYDDFAFRFRFKLEPGSNNGIAIRAPLSGDAAYQGMEVQVLENSHPKYAGLKPWQFHASVYGLGPALRGYQRPPGEWNDQEIIADGRWVKVILNGKVINYLDVVEAAEQETASGRPHPGAARKAGHIGFCGHGDAVEFKDLRIQPLRAEKPRNE
jgi:hypothetical protein